jgi:hypothetical protein
LLFKTAPISSSSNIAAAFDYWLHQFRELLVNKEGKLFACGKNGMS